MQTKKLLILFIFSLSCSFSNAGFHTLNMELRNPAFDNSLYENSLDPAECERQLWYIRSDSNLRLQFLDAGLRIPKAITQGNTLDFGNYHGCLAINQAWEDSVIQGKYCMINIPANQEISFPELPELPEFPEGIFPNGTIVEEMLEVVVELNKLGMDKELTEKVKLFMATNAGMLRGNFGDSRTNLGDNIGSLTFRMATCVPKSCTAREGLNGLLFNTTALGFQFTEEFCRLPNDKPWAPVDYVAIVIFSLIGLITVLSTLYDLRNHFILRRDRKSVNPLYTSFSVYTNARRLTTFTKRSGTLECVDGIRAISMSWIIIGHTGVTLPPYFNIVEAFEWQLSFSSIWLTSAPFGVDTFFMLSGMLLVYTTAGKFTGSKLMRSLHLFYLNRILRMLPLLAATLLLQTSFLHWVADGPLWNNVAGYTNTCRTYWWLNLLYIQNFFDPMCLGHSWYLAIDMQLHILSPILLYFVLSSSKRQAWAALAAGLLATLTASSIYVFIMQLPGSSLQPGRAAEGVDYFTYYYMNTLTRAAPFFVGMVFGYILHLCRHKPKFSKATVLLLWIVAIGVGALSLYSLEPMKDVNHDKPVMDSFVNAYSRASWALAVASLIVVCANGYGGPVDWLLSLQMWKLLSRISYAMYLFHFPMLFTISATYVQPVYFSVIGLIYVFFSQFVLSFIFGFFGTLLIDSPFSIIFKQLMGEAPKKIQEEEMPQKIDGSRHEEPKKEIEGSNGR